MKALSLANLTISDASSTPEGPNMNAAALLYVIFLLTLISGWVNNILWTFQQTEVVPVALGILGALVAPIGSLHGIYLFF